MRFDHAAEWPVRMAVVRSGGAPVRLVALYSHLALDGAGLDVLLDDVAAAGPDEPVTATPPLGQAGWETGPAGQRHNAGTLRHWERHLRAVPARRFPPPAAGPPPRFRELRSRSRALELAARLVAARTGVATPAVLLAASATALARVTGTTPSVQLILASNRFRAGFAGSVSTVSQPGLCVVDTAGVGFDEAVRRAWRASLAAYEHAYCDPAQRDALHDRVCAERGEQVELICYFNNRRTRPTPAGPLPTAADVRAAAADGWLRWSESPQDPSSEPFFVTVADEPDEVHPAGQPGHPPRRPGRRGGVRAGAGGGRRHGRPDRTDRPSRWAGGEQPGRRAGERRSRGGHAGRVTSRWRAHQASGT